MSVDRTDTAASRSTRVTAVARIAVDTGDLGRFRTFYEGLLGLPHVISLRMQDPPHLVYGVLAIGRDTVLQAVEVPGFDPAVDGSGAGGGRSGRIDRFALLVENEASLQEVRDRLVAAGSSDGAVTTMGPYLSVRFRDPDGLEGAITCPDPSFDPTRSDDEVVECSTGPEWTSDLLTSHRGTTDPDA